MINRNVLMLTLLAIVAAAAVAIQTRSSAQTQAQATGGHRWEYCAVTSITREGCVLLTSTLWVAGYLSSKPNWRLRSVFHCGDGVTVGAARISNSMANTVLVSTSTITLPESRQSPEGLREPSYSFGSDL